MSRDKSTEPLLEARKITKRFPGTVALLDVDIAIQRGEVVAVVGENGAGKSTLMKTLAGVLQVDSGQILVDGEIVILPTVRDATELGIVLIHQELNLLPNLTVAANLFLSREPRQFGWINRRALQESAMAALKRIGLDVAPETWVSSLSIGQRQLVEIARALSCDARILIMDEPTSSLSESEAEKLFDVIRELRERGVSVLYVSHRLAEVEEIADRVVVLRDGQVTGQLAGENLCRDQMVRYMVGRDVARVFERTRVTPGPIVMSVQDLVCSNGSYSPLSFDLYEGEIVGLAGLVGSGRSTLLRTLFGIDPTAGGLVEVGGRPFAPSSPRSAIACGVALVPEDRGTQGLVLAMATRPNLTLGSLHRNRVAGGLLDNAWEKEASVAMVAQMEIHGAHPGRAARNLSGGNQQKVVLGKWLLQNPRVLLMDEPTRGIDIGAKQEIYRAMEALAAEGMAILFASSEMEEILALSDRVLVMHDGVIAGELEATSLSEESIMHLATGHEQDSRVSYTSIA